YFLPFRLPSMSTLFPYTTLFRSRDPAPAGARRADRIDRRRRRGHCLVGGDLPGDPDPGARGARADRRAQAFGIALQAAVGGTARDRKSTRLNSSHQIISYAVFCL